MFILFSFYACMYISFESACCKNFFVWKYRRLKEDTYFEQKVFMHFSSFLNLVYIFSKTIWPNTFFRKTKLATSIAFINILVKCLLWSRKYSRRDKISSEVLHRKWDFTRLCRPLKVYRSKHSQTRTTFVRKWYLVKLVELSLLDHIQFRSQKA